jgi:hypothetical protein
MKYTFTLFSLLVFSTFSYSQCTEAKDADMAKYKRLTETQDAQGCSQCAMLALYFCSAKHCVEAEDKRKVRSLIEACKTNIKTMGQPYCCPELVNKEPEWGIAVGATPTGSSSKNTSATNASNSGAQQQQSLEALSSGLASSPENPLGVDNVLLNELVSLIPDDNLKNILQGYATSISNNEEISYRQVYNDVLSAFDMNPAIGMMDQYNVDQGALDLMFNQPEVLQDFFVSTGVAQTEEQARLYSFSTQAMLNNYSNYNPADVIGAGLDLITVMIQDAAQTAERTRILKARYKELFDQTLKSKYLEKDPKLGAALIDTHIGTIGNKMLTSIYRYDCDSSCGLRVEKGILKYINPKLNMSKELCIAEFENSGDFGSGSVDSVYFGTGNRIIVAEGIDAVFLSVARDNMNTAKKVYKCKNCLDKGTYMLSLKDGSILWESNIELNYSINYDDYRYKTDGNVVAYNPWLYLKKIALAEVELPFSSKKRAELYEIYQFDKNHDFNYNGLIPSKEFLEGKEREISYGSQYSSTISQKEVRASLFWGSIRKFPRTKDFTRIGSTVFCIASSSGYTNSDAMTNELTGLAQNKQGDLFIVNTQGKLAKLSKESYQLDSPEFINQIRKSLVNKILPTFDLSTLPVPVVSNGNGMERNLYAQYPHLTLSPDEKWLLYVIKDELFIIDPTDFKKIKSYKLMNQPHRTYFGKENGDWVLYLQSINEFQFPITKKYSMKRLTQDTPPPKAPVEATSTSKDAKGSSSNSSTNKKSASSGTKNTSSKTKKEEELQRLIDLYTKGLINEDEFKKAKAKLNQ